MKHPLLVGHGCVRSARRLAAALLTLTDADGPPTVTLAVSPRAIAENGGTATLSHASSAATTVTVTAVDGLYTVGADATITIAAEHTANAADTATVAAVDNDRDEAGRTATVANALGTVRGALLTLTDDDDEPALWIDSPRVSEGDSGTVALEFTVTLNAASGKQVKVEYADAGTGTATRGTDYTALADGTLTFAAGDTTRTITVSVWGDALQEPDETVEVQLGSAINATVTSRPGSGVEVEGPGGDPNLMIGTGLGTGTITDDDEPPALSIDTPRVTEGDSGSVNLTFTVRLSAASGREVTVKYAAAGTDYTALTGGTLTIAAGETSKTVTVAVAGDTTDEPNETVVVKLSEATNASLGTATGTGTITDDDDPPALSIDAPRVTEGDSGSTNLEFTVRLTPASGKQVTVEYTDAGTGTASSGTDYAALEDGTLTIAAGQPSKTIVVSVTGDTTDEPDETVDVQLGNPTNATLARTPGAGETVVRPGDGPNLMIGTGTITNDDDPSLSIDSPSVTEGDSGSTNLNFTVSLDAASDQQVTVEYADAGTGTASAGANYEALAGGTLTFAAGETGQTIAVGLTGDAVDETSRTIAVLVTGNTVDEPDETVVLKLSGAANARLGTATGTGTITDDDEAPTDSSIAENGGTTTVTATLSHASSAATTVTMTAVSGLYTVGADATITIPAGSQSSNDTVTITAVDDAVDNVTARSGTVTATARNGRGIGAVTGAALTLTDDEATPTVALALSEPDAAKPDTINESAPGNASMVTAMLSGESSEAVTLTVAATAGTNAQATDFNLSAAKTLTIAAGATASTGTVTVTAAPDTEDEPDQQVSVTATVSGRSGIAAPAAATLTIADDDGAPTVTLAVTPASIAENGGTATVTARLAHPSSQAPTVTVGATAGPHAVSGDFALSDNKTLTIAAGATASTGTVEITAQDNPQDEPDKTVRVTGTAANSQGIEQPAAVSLTITDDDGAPALAIDAPSVAEGDRGSTDLTFTVRLTPASGQQVTVGYAEGPGGTAGTDYTALADGTLTFAAGDTSRTIIVAVTGDTTDEPTETVEVTLSEATKARLGTATGTGTITDDDDAPTVTLALSPASIAESGGTATVTARLAHPSSQATTVTVGATAGPHAVSGDFALSANKTLTIAAGATASTGTVTVTAQDNTQDEPDKRVEVSGTATNRQGVGQPAAVPLTITDDDEAPALAIDAPSVAEGDRGSAALTFTVTLTPASGQQVTVGYAEGPGGTAAAGTDYTALADGTLTFAAGATSRTLTVAVTGTLWTSRTRRWRWC